MKQRILFVVIVLAALALCLLPAVCFGQTAGQFAVPKWTAGGLSYKWLTPVNGRFFGIDGSGNPAMLSGGGGAGLDNLASTITGETLTFTGTLTAGRALNWRDVAGTVALTSDLSAYAPLASPTFTGTVTIPGGASISGYATTTDVASGYQPLDADLTALAGLTSAVDRLPYYTGSGTAALATFTSAARSLLDDSNAAAMRVTLGLGSIATQSSSAVSITGGVISGTSIGASSAEIGAGGITIEDPANPANITNLYGASGASPGLYLPPTGTVILSNLSALNADNVSTGTVAAARLGSGSSITTKYLRGDNTWQTISGGGDALTTSSLDQFADVTQAATKTLAITESTTLAGGTHSGTNTGDQTTITGNAGTATALQTGRAINGVTFDGTSAITVTAAAGTLSGSTLASGVTASSLTSAAGGSFGTAAFTASSAYEVPLTFGTGLTRTTNTITVNTSQSLSVLSNLTTNGFVKTTGGTGTLSVDTSTYLTTTGNGSSLTGLAQSQVSGLTTTDRASFANIRPTHSTLTYAGTTDLDMDGNGFQTVTLTGNVTFTTSNRAAGRCKTIRIVGDTSTRTLTFPSWTFVGAAAPASLAANKDAVLTITAFGTADTDVVAAYAVEP